VLGYGGLVLSPGVEGQRVNGGRVSIKAFGNWGSEVVHMGGAQNVSGREAVALGARGGSRGWNMEGFVYQAKTLGLNFEGKGLH
jgi:hypothetical protein